MFTEKDFKTLDAILEKYDKDPSRVIGIMQDIQREYRYLPKESTTRIRAV